MNKEHSSAREISQTIELDIVEKSEKIEFLEFEYG